MAVQKANEKKALKGTVISDDDRRKLVSTDQSLDNAPSNTPQSDSISALESFSLSENVDKEELDADTLFKTPTDDKDS